MKTSAAVEHRQSLSFSRNHQNSIFLLSLLFFLLSPERAARVSGQPEDPDDNSDYARLGESMTLIIAVISVSLLLMVILSIYIHYCADSSSAVSFSRAISMISRRVTAARGLDASLIETFPMFKYSEVKVHKIGKGALECVVCLNEFGDDETLRLIPKCDHVFHPECIDAWLEYHVTCPVCRANLMPEAGDEPFPVPDWRTTDSSNDEPNNEPNNENDFGGRTGSGNQEFVIRVEEEQNQEARSFKYPNRPTKTWSIQRLKMFEFSKFKSHSTGHESLVQPGDDLDRFTLRLPAGVRKEIMNRVSINRISSLPTTLPREGRSSSWRRIDRDREEKTNRWGFLTRVMSIRFRGAAEIDEASGSKAADEAGLVSGRRS